MADNAVPATRKFNEEQLKPGAERAGEGLKTGADRAGKGLQDAADKVSQQAGQTSLLTISHLYRMPAYYTCDCNLIMHGL